MAHKKNQFSPPGYTDFDDGLYYYSTLWLFKEFIV